MEKVLLKREKGISYITLNRPKQYNALDGEMLEKLLTIIKEIEKNDDRIVILSGKGDAFCAGGDISMMGKNMEQQQMKSLMNTIKDISLKLYLLPKIVISVVHGSAAGLGLSMALNSDFIVAHHKAKFGMLFAGIGLIPDGGGHFFLRERLGTHQAKQFIWGLQQIQSEQAKRLGMVDIISEDVQEASLHLVNQLQTSALQAIIKSKMIYHEQRKNELIDYLYAESSAQLEMGQTRDHEEGVQAFLEKRKPHFSGK